MKAKIYIKYIDGTSREVETSLIKEFTGNYWLSVLVNDSPELIKEMIVKPIHEDKG